MSDSRALKLHDSKPVYYSKATFGFLFPLLSAGYGLLKGTYCFFESWFKSKSPANYFYDGFRGDSLPNAMEAKNDFHWHDRRARTMTYTFTLGRTFAVAVGVICILGFLGALVVPLPGTTPVYVAGVTTTIKALGWGALLKGSFWGSLGLAALITNGYVIGARLVGATIGGLVDSRKVRKIEQNMSNHEGTEETSLSRSTGCLSSIIKRLDLVHVLKCGARGAKYGVKYGIIGEAVGKSKPTNNQEHDYDYVDPNSTSENSVSSHRGSQNSRSV